MGSPPLALPYGPSPDSAPAAEVLRQAFQRAAEEVGLARAAQAALLGVSEASLSRLARGQRQLEPASKEGELALLFLRSWRSLDALVGGDPARARAWMQAENVALGGIPCNLVQNVTGLVHVLEYLDALRGKL